MGKFQSDCDTTLIGMNVMPTEEYLEYLYREQVEKDFSPKWQAVLDMYDHDIRYKGKKK